jgi:hypothetical protein
MIAVPFSTANSYSFMLILLLMRFKSHLQSLATFEET